MCGVAGGAVVVAERPFEADPLIGVIATRAAAPANAVTAIKESISAHAQTDHHRETNFGGEGVVTMNAHDLKLDYFKLYNIEPMPHVSYRVSLEGQLDELPEKAELSRLRMFATPASKNGEPLYDRNAHLTLYELEVRPWILDPGFRIVTESQFGHHRFDVKHEFALLAPAKKYEPGLRHPRHLDHYKMYSIDPHHRVSLDVDVTLEDQLGKVEGRIETLMAFGVPVDKEHDGKSYEVNNETAHLMMFKCETAQMGRHKQVRDQFDRYRLYLGRGRYLLVPCLKHEARELH